MEILLTFAILLSIATVLAILLHRIKISPIVGFIITGLLVGPGLGLIEPQSDFVKVFSNIGIALIAFQIGCSVKLGFMRRYGVAIPLVAILELIFVVVVATILGVSAGFGSTLILILILISINTSTAIAFKILEERGQIATPSATLVFAVATIEDIIVMAGISFIPTIAKFGTFGLQEAVYSVSFLVFMTLIMLVVGLQALPRILNRIAKQGSQEILLLTTLTLAIGYGWLGSYIGVSFALGAFLAGLIVSSTGSQDTLTSGIAPLKDIFAMIFFVSIGLNIPSFSGSGLLFALLIAVMLIFTKYFSFTSAAWLAGNRLNEAMRMGFYMVPISEFALIVSLDAYNYGLVNEQILLVGTLVVLFSVLLGSGLTRNDTRNANALSRLVPQHIQLEVNALTSWTMRNLTSWFYLKDASEIIFNILKKVLVIILLLSIGTASVYALNNIVMEWFLIELLQLMIVATVSIISLIEVISFRKDVERLSSVLVLSRNGSAREKLANTLKGGLNILVLLVVALFLVIMTAVFIRGILEGFLESYSTSLVVFLFVCGLMLVIMIPAYGQIKRLLHSLERSMDSL